MSCVHVCDLNANYCYYYGVFSIPKLIQSILWLGVTWDLLFEERKKTITNLGNIRRCLVLTQKIPHNLFFYLYTSSLDLFIMRITNKIPKTHKPLLFQFVTMKCVLCIVVTDIEFLFTIRRCLVFDLKSHCIKIYLNGSKNNVNKFKQM